MFAVPSFFGYNTTFVNTPVATAATGVGETSFTANWNAFSGASYYLLDVSLSSSFSSFVLQDTVTTATSYVVTGLTASTTYYYRIRAAINVDSDVAGFVSRVYAASGSLSYTEVTATETLVADLKSYGIWTSMKAVYPMVGASAAACAQNLVSSSFTGTFTSGWTFASTGVKGNGTSAYMDTFFNISLQANWVGNNHFSFYSRTQTPSGSGWNMGVGNASNGLPLFGLAVVRSGNAAIYDSGDFPVDRINVTQSDGQGFWLGSASSTSSRTFTKNGSTIGVSTTTTTATASNDTIYLGALNNTNGSDYFMSQECAFSSIGESLTSTQASNFYTAVQTFNTSLSRQV